MAERAGLETLFDPRSVAVVGASDDRVKWGHWLACARCAGRTGAPSTSSTAAAAQVLGRPAHRSLAELPEPIELAVLSVPAAALEQAVTTRSPPGARAIVAITGGERDGDAGGARDAALAAIACARPARACSDRTASGVFDAGAELELVSDDLPRGAIGLISQSGNLALEIGALAARGRARLLALRLAGQPGGRRRRRSWSRALAAHERDAADRRSTRRTSATAARSPRRPSDRRRRQAGAAARGRAHRGDRPRRALAHRRAGERRARGRRRVRAPPGSGACARRASWSTPPRRSWRLPGRARPARGGASPTAAGTAGSPPALAHDARAGASRRSAPALAGARSRDLLAAARRPCNPVDMAGGGEQDVLLLRPARGALLRPARSTRVLLTGYFGGYAEYADRRPGVARSRSPREALTAAAASGPAAGRPQHARRRGRPLDALRAGGVPVYDDDRARASRALGATRRGTRAGGGRPAAAAAGGARGGQRGYAAARALLAAGGVPFVAAAPAADAAEASRPRAGARLPGGAQGARRCCTSPTRAASCSASRTRPSCVPPSTAMARGSPPRRSRSSAWRRSRGRRADRRQPLGRRASARS